jgi:hypothetical protein
MHPAARIKFQRVAIYGNYILHRGLVPAMRRVLA